MKYTKAFFLRLSCVLENVGVNQEEYSRKGKKT